MAQERIAHAGLISLLGSAFAALAALLLTVVVGRGLGPSGTGLFYQAVALFTIARGVLLLGANTGIIRTFARQGALDHEGSQLRTMSIAIVPVVVVSAGFCLLVIATAPDWAHWLASSSSDADTLARLLQLLAPFIAIAAVLGVLHSAVRMLRGVLSFTMLQNVLLPLSRLGLVALAVAVGWGAYGTTLAWAVALPVWLVVTVVWLADPVLHDHRARTAERREPSGHRESWAEFWRFSSARGVGAAVEQALDWSDVLIVAALLSPAEAGVYAVATRAVRAGQVVDRSMRIAVAPSIAHLLALGHRRETSAMHADITGAMVLVSWPFYLTLIVMGPAIMGLFGADFVDGWPVLAAVGSVMLLAVVGGMVQSIMLMGGKSSWQVYNKSAVLALSVGFNLLLVPMIGVMGAAVTWALVVLVDNGIAAFLVHSRIGVDLMPLRVASSTVLPLLVFGAGGLAFRLLFGSDVRDLLGFLALLGSIYAVCLWFLRDRLGLTALWSEVGVHRVATPASAGQP